MDLLKIIAKILGSKATTSSGILRYIAKNPFSNPFAKYNKIQRFVKPNSKVSKLLKARPGYQAYQTERKRAISRMNYQKRKYQNVIKQLSKVQAPETENVVRALKQAINVPETRQLNLNDINKIIRQLVNDKNVQVGETEIDITKKLTWQELLDLAGLGARDYYNWGSPEWIVFWDLRDSFPEAFKADKDDEWMH